MGVGAHDPSITRYPVLVGAFDNLGSRRSSLLADRRHICEHILSKLSQVVARDSSIVTANVQDLYTALCEDDSVYGFFKRMDGEYSSLLAVPNDSHPTTRSDHLLTWNYSEGANREPCALFDEAQAWRPALSVQHGCHAFLASRVTIWFPLFPPFIFC